jgi:predicted neutral ceramidase superfamily lipid hydrolase
MAYRSNYGYTSPIALVGNDFKVSFSSTTVLALTLHVDSKLYLRRSVFPLAFFPFFALIFIIPMAAMLLTPLTQSDLIFIIPFSFFVLAMLVCLLGDSFETWASRAKKLTTFQLVLDKEANKMTLSVQSPLSRNDGQMLDSNRIGQVTTAAWDLNKVEFRLLPPGERSGPGTT